MKISVVTISFNQAHYLEEAIISVLNQNYDDMEYIIVDPGSSDGSREIISKYSDRVTHIIFEKDSGPAHGLNKGFKNATGEIFCFLNADDILLPNALSAVRMFFSKNNNVDVLSGHSFIIGEKGQTLRLSKSNKFSLKEYIYGVSVLMQPSTFFKSHMFLKVKGFNEYNNSNWDGELFLRMALNGAKFAVINKYMSGYRIHTQSITGSKKMDKQIKNYQKRIFREIMGREYKKRDYVLKMVLKSIVYTREPLMLYERITKGPIYGGSKYYENK